MNPPRISERVRALRALAVILVIISVFIATTSHVAMLDAQEAAPQPAPFAGTAGAYNEAPPAATAPSASSSFQAAVTAQGVTGPANPSGDGIAPPPQPTTTPDLSSQESSETASASVPAETTRLPHDLSPWKMFASADSIVKSVMIGLILASIATWTIGLAKSLELAVARRRLRHAFLLINSAGSLAEASQRLRDIRKGVVSALIAAAILELRLSANVTDKAGIKERVLSRLDGRTAAAGRDMNRGTGLLATIGSTSPFIGLFGTVWGIMNSFIGISETQTTNLAVVAPGIAEALLATATGLVAAIPAVITYNHFSRQIGGYKAMMGEASAEVMRLVSRDLDCGLRTFPTRQAAE